MKKSVNLSILIMLFVALTSNLIAQNWNLLNQNERYHFRKFGDSLPIYTLFIDSLLVNSSDTTFYMNRFFLPCDTCTMAGLYLDNQPGFLQREWAKLANGLHVIQNPDELFIQVTGTIGDHWWFDTDETRMAKVETLQIENVFGIQDSVLTILVDDTLRIKLSKSKGLIQYFESLMSH